jgi:hypothetical protein
MKNTFTAFMILATFCVSTFSSAEDIVIPVIAKPSVLQEGTQRELSAQQVAELLPWAKNSKSLLEDVVNGLQGLSSVDKIERLELGIASVVNESAPKNSELLMRYVLNRSLVLNNALKAEMSEQEVGTADTKLRVLLSSVKMALKYYDLDMEVLNKKSTIQFAKFGIDYFKFLNDLNKSIFDASAGYVIQKTALEWLQWDLYRDLNNASFAPQIIKINNGLKLLPAKKISDAQALTYIRQMKLITSQLTFMGFKVVQDEVEVTEVSEQVTRPYRSKNIQECSGILGSDSARNTCIAYSNIFYIAPKVVQTCGGILGSESARLSCLQKLANLDDDPLLLKGMKACGKMLGSDSTRLTCLDSLVSSDMDKFEEIAAVCGSSLGSDSTRLLCLQKSLSYKIDTSFVKTCGEQLGSDSSRLSCMDKIKNRFNEYDSKGIATIKGCGAAMGSDSSRLSCIDKALQRSISLGVIIDCSVMGSDSARLTCMDN